MNRRCILYQLYFTGRAVLYADGKFGKPFVEGAKVTGVVEKQGKGKKITIVKYKAKKSSTRRKQGHRQPYTRVKIEAIEA